VFTVRLDDRPVGCRLGESKIVVDPVGDAGANSLICNRLLLVTGLSTKGLEGNLRVVMYVDNLLIVSPKLSLASRKGNSSEGSCRSALGMPSKMVTWGSEKPKSISSSSSSWTVTSSTGGLLASEFDDTGVSRIVSSPVISTSDSSTLILTSSVVATGSDRIGLVDDERDEGIASSGGREGVRTLIVTRLDRGSEGVGRASTSTGWAGCCSGVVGIVGSVSIFIAESLFAWRSESLAGAGATESKSWRSCVELTVSTDRLLEVPPAEVRRRFRDEISLSSNGFGRVEQGSDDTARSLGSSACEA